MADPDLRLRRLTFYTTVAAAAAVFSETAVQTCETTRKNILDGIYSLKFPLCIPKGIPKKNVFFRNCVRFWNLYNDEKRLLVPKNTQTVVSLFLCHIKFFK